MSLGVVDGLASMSCPASNTVTGRKERSCCDLCCLVLAKLLRKLGLACSTRGQSTNKKAQQPICRHEKPIRKQHINQPVLHPQLSFHQSIITTTIITRSSCVKTQKHQHQYYPRVNQHQSTPTLPHPRPDLSKMRIVAVLAWLSFNAAVSTAAVIARDDPYAGDFRTFGEAGCSADNQGVGTIVLSRISSCTKYPLAFKSIATHGFEEWQCK